MTERNVTAAQRQVNRVINSPCGSEQYTARCRNSTDLGSYYIKLDRSPVKFTLYTYQFLRQCNSGNRFRTLRNGFLQGLPQQASVYEGRLTISNARASDSGDYVCSAVDIPSVRSASSRLSVEPVGKCKRSLIIISKCICFHVYARVFCLFFQ